MEYFCRKCGTTLVDFCCPDCGTKYRVKKQAAPTYMPGMLHDKSPQEIVKMLKLHEYISCGIWIVIGILQIALFAFALMGICNIIVSVLSLLYATRIEPYKYEVYERYEGQLPVIIVSVIANVLVGGVIGVIGCIYDLYIRSYVLKNKYAFNRI